MDKNKLVKVDDKNEISNLIQQAIMNKTPVEVMERLFVLHKEVKAEFAREEYVKALAKFQGECPIIEKTKKVLNKDGRTIRYQYAPLEAVIKQIKKVLADNNLSYSWDVNLKDKNMKVMVKLTHSFGHTETSLFEIPISAEGYMTEPQKYASAQTYAKRYTLLNVLGIATADEDTDATDVCNHPDAQSAKAKIVFLLRTLKFKTDTKAQIEKAVQKVAQLELIEKNYKEIVDRLDATVKEKQEYEKEYPNENN